MGGQGWAFLPDLCPGLSRCARLANEELSGIIEEGREGSVLVCACVCLCVHVCVHARLCAHTLSWA